MKRIPQYGLVAGVLMGAVFGFALEKSRVFEPGMIVGQMQMRNFTMLKIFLTAVTTGLIVIGVMHGFFGVKIHPKALMVGADVIGGLLLGVGIALAGACPGTVFAQIGVPAHYGCGVGERTGGAAFAAALPADVPAVQLMRQ